MLRAAKETISLAEQRLLEDDKRQFDSAWQEMLNHATQRVSHSRVCQGRVTWVSLSVSVCVPVGMCGGVCHIISCLSDADWPLVLVSSACAVSPSRGNRLPGMWPKIAL